MTRRIMIAFAALSLSGCSLLPALIGLGGIPAPQTVANRTQIDEQVGHLVTVAYDAAAQAASFAIENRGITDPVVIHRIGQLDMCAYALVQGVHIAYQSGNSATYTEAVNNARLAITTLLHAAQGIANANDTAQCASLGGAGNR